VDAFRAARLSARVTRNPATGPEAGATQVLYDVYNGSRAYLIATKFKEA